MTALVKIAIISKELVVAWRFGTGDALDAFFIAWLVPSFIIVLLPESFNAALIPTYIRVREQEGLDAAQQLLSKVIVWGLGLLAITTILMVATAPLYLPLLARGFSPQKLELTFYLLCTITPVVMLSGIVVIWSAVLNAQERFALAAIAPAMTALVTIAFLVGNKSWGIFALTGGLVGGTLLEMLLLGVALKRQGISLLPTCYRFDPHLRQVVSQYAPIMAGAFLMSSTTLVDQAMAARLSSGSVAALNYGMRVIALPISLITTALSTAIIPYLSKMVAAQDWKGVRSTMKRYLWLIFLVTVPIAGFIYMYSQPIVELLLQRGSFTAQDTYIVAKVQAMYVLQLPFYVAGILVVRLISSMDINQVLIGIAGLNLLFNIGLNYLFMQWLGVQGIALSTSCVYVFSFFSVLLLAYRNLRKIENESR
ncbi:MAG: oligosaccharide flippase family protein [Symplocastrum torsivum CPER-KK1]|uniref:Oligosaccharide flippase family protein n=1 Tax=Symplocastrum torsivum CPER-KK1 TaxID=450513 RepID=A0A951U858_9CYAN|nr:oligosaccharide flippase family protein [Symplocastrum torsivum CPER-KK1]